MKWLQTYAVVLALVTVGGVAIGEHVPLGGETAARLLQLMQAHGDAPSLTDLHRGSLGIHDTPSLARIGSSVGIGAPELSGALGWTGCDTFGAYVFYHGFTGGIAIASAERLPVDDETPVCGGVFGPSHAWRVRLRADFGQMFWCAHGQVFAPATSGNGVSGEACATWSRVCLEGVGALGTIDYDQWQADYFMGLRGLLVTDYVTQTGPCG